MTFRRIVWRAFCATFIVVMPRTAIRAQGVAMSTEVRARAKIVDEVSADSGERSRDFAAIEPRADARMQQLRDHSGALLFAPEKVRPSPWWAPVASALIPGTGQIALSQQRSVAYGVAELYLLLQAVAAQRDGNRDRERYQTVAADVARKQFGGRFPVGPWVTYYEPMEKYLESGAYSLARTGPVLPETDESTYNGARWLLARQTYWRDPTVAPATTSAEYSRALAFYVRDAVTDEYRWSWRDAQLQWDVYRQIIVTKNRNYQRANNYVGLVVANHLISLVDAYVSVRVRRFGGAGLLGLRVDGVSNDVILVGDPASGTRRWQASLRLVPRSH